MLEIACLVLLFVVWYILVDHIASSRVEYLFPAGCCSCGSQSNLQSWALRRDWYFSGIDVLEKFFPEPIREADIPICGTCLNRLEAHKRRNLTIAAITAASLTVPLAILINKLVKEYSDCVVSPLGVKFCTNFLWVFGGVMGGLFLFFILWELTSIIPGLALPARFNFLGKLRFTNPDYRKNFKYLNPSPEIPVPQHQIPWGIYLGAFFALFFSILSDLDVILTGHRHDPSLQIFPTYYLLVFGKAGAMAMFWRMKKVGLLIWVIIIASDIFMNPNFNIKDRGEDLVFAAALFLIFFYKWWLTRRYQTG